MLVTLCLVDWAALGGKAQHAMWIGSAGWLDTSFFFLSRMFGHLLGPALPQNLFSFVEFVSGQRVLIKH